MSGCFFARASVAIAVLASVAGCTSMYKESGEKFAKAYDEASKTINTTLDAQTKARRMLGLHRYVEKGPQDDNINADLAESFTRYVCAGEGDFAKQRAAIGVLGSYKRIIADISKTPDDSVGALWKSIQKNQEERAPLKPPADAPTARDECIRTVGDLLEKQGLALAPRTPESVAALKSGYDGLKALVGALEGLLISVLKIADEAVRAEALRNFVKKNQATIDEIFKKELADAALRPAYERRMAAALVAPYVNFRSLQGLKWNDPGDRVKILKIGATVHDQLEPFDVLRQEASPSQISKAMAEAHQQLVDLADGKISVKQAWAALSAIVQMLKDVDEAAGKVKKQIGS